MNSGKSAMYRGGTLNALVGLSYLRAFPAWDGRSGVSLDVMRVLLDELGNPQDQLRTVHIAGTNGKGSVAVLVASMLGAAGHSVGLTTSPHLTRMNERVIIDGLPISDELLDRYAQVVGRAAGRCGVELSFFLAITAVAFLAFADLELAWAVVETGLGGRLDGTNVIAKPEVSAIVSVDIDHAAVLGSTLAKIAREKAGIAKPGVPMVVGSLSLEAMGEIEDVARQNSCPLYRFGTEFELMPEHVTCGLAGAYQMHNFAVASQIARLLGLDDEAVSSGARSAHWPARFEEIHVTTQSEIGAGEQIVVIDSAHNEAGFRALISSLLERGYPKVILGFGALQDKEWRAMVELLRPIVSQWHILTPQSSRAVLATEVAGYLSGFNISSSVHESAEELFKDVFGGPAREPLVRCGSIYLVGQLREVLRIQSGVDSSLFGRSLWVRRKHQ